MSTDLTHERRVADVGDTHPQQPEASRYVVFVGLAILAASAWLSAYRTEPGGLVIATVGIYFFTDGLVEWQGAWRYRHWKDLPPASVLDLGPLELREFHAKAIGVMVAGAILVWVGLQWLAQDAPWFGSFVLAGGALGLVVGPIRVLRPATVRIGAQGILTRNGAEPLRWAGMANFRAAKGRSHTIAYDRVDPSGGPKGEGFLSVPRGTPVNALADVLNAARKRWG